MINLNSEQMDSLAALMRSPHAVTLTALLAENIHTLDKLQRQPTCNQHTAGQAFFCDQLLDVLQNANNPRGK